MSKETEYLYYEITFKNCHMDYNTTIVESLDDVKDYLQLVETDLDAIDSDAEVAIRGIGMTRKEYDKWFKEHVKP